MHTISEISSLACFDPLILSLCVCAQPLPEWEYNGNAEQVGYRVQYSRAGSQGRALIHIITDRLEREFTIEDLEEWTEYEVRVQAVNGIGTGPLSQPVRGRTRESGELIILQLKHLKRNTITISSLIFSRTTLNTLLFDHFLQHLRGHKYS